MDLDPLVHLRKPLVCRRQSLGGGRISWLLKLTAWKRFDGAMQCGNAPIRYFVHEDVERGLVELDHIDAVGGERPRLLIQQAGERHRELDFVAVVAIRDRVHDGHRPGKREFQPAFGVGAGEPGFGGVHAPLEPHRADDGRHHGLVAILADAHFDAPGKIDALDMLEKSVNEMLTRLLAVRHDVDSRVLLLLDDEQRGIALGRRELRTGKPPRRPQLVGLGKPGRLGQAAGDRGGEHRVPRAQSGRQS